MATDGKRMVPMTCYQTAQEKEQEKEREHKQEQKESRFLQWLRAEGATTADLSLANFDGVRGIRANSAIVCGENLVTLPRKLTLCVGNNQPCPFPQFVSAKFWQQSSMHVQLALRLLYEMEREDSRLAPWLQLLPTSHADKPSRWTDAEVQQLEVREGN
eukprot:747186-Hanusia_phi.AAC.2